MGPHISKNLEDDSILWDKGKEINRKGPEREYIAVIRRANYENPKGYSRKAVRGDNGKALNL
ncbi:1108_t:CDS:2 [Gigaspora rosea]|nr:1108_t:CDS:2 [Gigaspora rosea]